MRRLDHHRILRPSARLLGVAFPLVLAGHWTSGSGGVTTGMIFMVAVPYLLIGAAAVLLSRHLRR